MIVVHLFLLLIDRVDRWTRFFSHKLLGDIEMLRKNCFGSLLFVFSFFCIASQSDAAFAVRISTNGGLNYGGTIYDADDGDEDGFISATVNNIRITASASGSTSLSSSFVGLEVNGGGYTLNAPALNVKVQATFTGLITEPSPQELQYVYTSGGAGSALVTTSYSTFVNSSAIEFDTTGDLANIGPSGVVIGGTFFTGAVPYSMTTQTSIVSSFNAGGRGTFNTTNDNTINASPIAPAPAPAGFILAASALPFFGFFRRRLSKKSSTTVVA